MPFQKLQFKPGFTRDLTALAAEGGWYAGDKVRFRMGFPEKIGGWQRISAEVYQGLCRSLSAWTTLSGAALIGVGTHLKLYVCMGGVYYDVTPVRASFTVAANAFTTTNGSNVVVGNVVGHGAATGDFVELSGAAAAVGGISAAQLTGDYQVTVIDGNHVSFVVSSNATSGATGGNTVFDFQLPVGLALSAPSSGYGAGSWGSGTWGNTSGVNYMRNWTQCPFGELLVFGQVGGALYQFTPTFGGGGFDRGVGVATLPGASSVPLFQNNMMFSPAARILVLFGTNPYGGAELDPLLVRWSDSDSIVEWAPAATNQSGEYRLQAGSKIVAATRTRQDALILTDTTAYVMQYLGAPYVFGFTQQSDNISVVSRNAAVTAGNGAVYWMGVDKFYSYDGRVQPLSCPLLNEIYGDYDSDQAEQVFGGTNEGFNEVWWFFCGSGQPTPNRYVIYNYVDNIWYYGTMERTAWLDTSLTSGPLAATAYSNLVVHESGLDDASTAASLPIEAYAQSADFDIGDGQNYAFVRKVLPDVNFSGSTASTPTVYMAVEGRKNPGSAPATTGNNTVAQLTPLPVTTWTDEVCIRLRGRQMNIRISSSDLGVRWQLGTPRIEVRPDGRKT